MLNIIAKNVKSKLTKKVRGTISCHVIGDTLICDIIYKRETFRYTEKFTQEEIACGLSSQHISEKIMYAYIYNIKHKFFK